ncbi:MAG: hypothetical protein KJZ47_03540 [Gemmatimonadales bacterium]|nr:hypothetical protein [Gemmatimonadales bacterium]
MEDILAIIGIFGGGTLVAVSFSPLGKAWADRIRGKGLIVQDPEVIEDLNALRLEVAELHERLDFNERLLAERRESGPVGS